MSSAADLAFRQAFALCPSAPETVFRYAGFLAAQGRKEDAIAVFETALPRAKSADRDPIAKALAELKAQKAH
jgi:Flp pilus assembly protein TadD